MQDFEDDNEDVMSWLEEEGALEWVGMSDEGERSLKINYERMKEVFPELYKSLEQEVMHDLEALYELGYVDLFMDESGQWKYSISDKGRSVMEKYGFLRQEEE